MKNKSLEGQLEGLNSFYSERREYQNKITSLEEVIDELNKKLGSNTDKSKEKEIAITNINTKLNKMARTKQMINSCLNEASGSIRAALALAEDSEEADIKASREDVLNQLLVKMIILFANYFQYFIYNLHYLIYNIHKCLGAAQY